MWFAGGAGPPGAADAFGAIQAVGAPAAPAAPTATLVGPAMLSDLAGSAGMTVSSLDRADVAVEINLS